MTVGSRLALLAPRPVPRGPLGSEPIERVDPPLEDVPHDERLAQLAFEAQKRFQEAKRRRKYLRALGPVLGKVIYAVSGLRPIRSIGRRIVRSGLVRGIRGLNQLGDRDPREGSSQTWS